MKGKKVLRYKGGPSEILESIHYEGYEIKSLKHGNTGHVLYCSPNKDYEWEDCWGMDLQTAKNNVLKHRQSKSSKKAQPISQTPVESKL